MLKRFKYDQQGVKAKNYEFSNDEGGETMKSIKVKLISIISLVFIGILLMTSIAVGFTSHGIISEQNSNKLIHLSDSISHEINGWLLAQGQVVEGVVNGILAQDEINKDQLLKQLQFITELNQYTSDVYMGFYDNSFLDGSGWTPPIDYNSTSRPWYIRAKERGGLVFGSPSFDMTTGQMVTVISMPVIKDDKLTGVIGMDLNLGVLEEISGKAGQSLGKSSYSFILDDNNNIMFHPNGELMPTEDKMFNFEDVIGTSVNKLIDNQSAGNIIKFKDYDGVNRYLFMSTIDSTNWKIGVAISSNDYMQPLRQLLSLLAICIMIAATIAIIIALLISNGISKPLILMSSAAKTMSTGDLTVEMDSVLLKREDEIGELAQAFYGMRNHLTDTLSQINHASEIVYESATILKESTSQSAIASEEVAKTIEEIARGASEHAKDTEYTASNISQLGDALDEDAACVVELNVAVQNINKETDEGFEILKKLVHATEKSNQATESIYGIIVSNDESAKKIEGASTMIKNIADQTNLLALNAAIEAARAGEAGKGFSVVADEIRKLAEESNRFTDEINTIISELKSKSSLAVQTMNEINIIVDDQTIRVNETETKFNGISDATNIMRNAVEKLNYSVEKMGKNKDNIIGLIQNLSAVSEENAAGTQEASASMEEQSVTNQEIANSGEHIASIAVDLRKLIEKFKI